MADAGFKLAVEGEREFKKAIAEINAQIKANAAELKLLTAQYGAADTGMEKLTANQKALEEGLALQGQKVSALREQYEKASATYGETDVRVVKLKTSLTEATAEYSKMSGEAEKNQAAIDAAWKAMEDYQEATAKASDVMGSLDDVMARNRQEIADLADQYKSLGDRSGDAAKKQENLTAQNKLLADSAESQRKKIDALNEELDAAVRLYGENSEEVRGYKDAVNDATGELEQMEQQIRDNNDAMSGSADAVSPLGGALDTILDKLGIQMPAELENLSGEGGGFSKAALAAGLITTAIVGAITKLAELTAEAAAWADETEKKAQASGISTEKLQALEYAGKQLGVEMEVIEDVIKEIGIKSGETDAAIQSLKDNTEEWNSMTVEEKSAAIAEETKKWDELGVSIYNASGEIKDSEDLFYELIDALGNVSNESERLSRMNELLGESSRNLAPFISAGSDAVRELEQEAHDLGVVVDQETVTALDDFQQELDMAAQKFDAFKVQMGNVGRETLNLVKGDGGLRELKDAVDDALVPLNALTEQMVGKSVGRIVWENTPIGGFIASVKNAYTWVKDLLNLGGSKTVKGGDIPEYASGTYNHPGGYAVVGEKGPEIVELPRGSRVYPSGTVPQMSESNVYNITIPARDIREFNDIIRIAQGQRQSIRMGYAGGKTWQ